MERIELLKIIKDNWEDFQEDFNGYYVIKPDYLKEKYGFTDEFLKPYIRNVQGGEGKHTLFDDSGNIVKEIEQSVWSLHLLNGLGNLLGNPDWYHFKRANGFCGRGREARNWKRVIGIAIGVYKASDEVEA
jgi:hypothetical protein